jgi:nucleotide-binding universal stress UspA family protein
MSRHIHKILVATSLEETSDHVVIAGRELARAAEAELHLLHAYPLAAAFYGSPLGMATVHPHPIVNEREQVELLLDQQLERVGVTADEVAGRWIHPDTPPRRLVVAARELAAELLVVGASDSHSPLEPLLGSTADRVLRQAHVPVLVVRGELKVPPQRVLVPVDLSDLCDQSVRSGIRILKDLVTGEPPCLETLFVLANAERKGSVQFTSEQIDRFAEEELKRHMALLAEETGWPVEPVLRTGSPRQEIVAELLDNPADLVVLGTHGRSGFERLLLGSVAADVVRRASTSVLVVPPAEVHEDPC